MDSTLLSTYSEANRLPMLADITTLGVDLPWPGYMTAMEAGTASMCMLVCRLAPKLEFLDVTTTRTSEASALPSASDVTGTCEDSLAPLELAAEAGDESALIRAADRVDWAAQPATGFRRAVHLALAAGAHLLARRLATYGNRLHPADRELQKMARLFAPPRVIRTRPATGPSLLANQAWLRAHAEQHRGKWVALQNGVLLAVGDSARDLRAHLKSTEGVMLTRVP